MKHSKITQKINLYLKKKVTKITGHNRIKQKENKKFKNKYINSNSISSTDGLMKKITREIR